MSLNNDTKDFLNKWKIKVVDDNKRIYKQPTPNTITHAFSETEILYTMQITQSDLDILSSFYQKVKASMWPTGNMDAFRYYIQQQTEEVNIREKHLAVKKAYDQYRMLYSLVGNPDA